MEFLFKPKYSSFELFFAMALMTVGIAVEGLLIKALTILALVLIVFAVSLYQIKRGWNF